MNNEKNDTLKKLQDELERTRSQLYIFYELTKIMRKTLRLEEIVYIILTGLTAHHGLGFNRACLFLVDEGTKTINGYMGIGSMEGHDADQIWHSIKNDKMDLYDLVEVYHRIPQEEKPKFMNFVQNLSFPLEHASGLVFQSLFEKGPLLFTKEKRKAFTDDPLVKKLRLEEFLVAPLWIKDRPQGLILVDNNITQKVISEDDTKIFNMFVEQAQGAIENSQAFEDTLTRSHTDPLTGLWNYGYFQYRLDEEVEKAMIQKSCVSVLMIDIDDFKKFNDTYGHVQGDNALKKITGAAQENCRKSDVLCRYGGEEFSLILPGIEKDEVYHFAQRIRDSVQAVPLMNGHLTVSIGIASFPHDGLDKESVILRADQALYEAKRQGKNRVILT